eukprot:Nitzschia sp. Nitz4//scaffold176_size46146//35976//36707//NITZ4_007196-RA/size46146-exonerate_est2genome-gene-0.22-mRNA-1//-1//CDS//3329539027//8937//frame0
MARHPTECQTLGQRSVTNRNSGATYLRRSSGKDSSKTMFEGDYHFCSLTRKRSLLGESSTVSTSTHSSSGLEPATSQQIRSRFLGRLGFVQPSVTNANIVPIRRKKPESNTTEAVLKKDLGKPDRTLTLESRPQQAKQNKRATVCFRATVTVHAIPHFKDYSPCTKGQMWMNPKELDEMAYRNCIEFAAEQWNWREATEERDFVLCEGKLTHPAHASYQRQYNLRRQFCYMMSARQQQTTGYV